MLEAKCSTCGEIFVPSDEQDLEHIETEMGEPCGGAGEIVGEWFHSGVTAKTPEPGAVWVVVTHVATATGGYVDEVEILDAPPTWDLAKLGQTCWLGNVNGGDSVRVR